MQSNNTFTRNIQHLIKVNYQRMMVFEQASFISDKDNLKSFYAERADECEAHLKELYAALNMSDTEGEDYAIHHSDTENIFLKTIPGKKNALRVLQSITALEKIVLIWYRNAIADIKSFPSDLIGTINRQYHRLGVSQSALEQL